MKLTEDILRQTTTRIVRWISSTLNEANRWRQGGWLHVTNAEGKLIFHEKIGTVPIEKNAKFRALSAEKALRLHEHPEHRSSWESRNPKKDQWGGAFRTVDGWIFSFAGFSEFWDESLVLLLVYNLGLQDEKQHLASTSFIDNNPNNNG